MILLLYSFLGGGKFFCLYFFKYILLIMLIQLFHFFSPLIPSTQYPISHPHSPFSSCPWVIHISSLASTFTALFLTSPCLFCAYHLCYLFPVPFPPFSPLHLPADNPPCDVYFCESLPVLVVCLIRFCFIRFSY